MAVKNHLTLELSRNRSSGGGGGGVWLGWVVLEMEGRKPRRGLIPVRQGQCSRVLPAVDVPDLFCTGGVRTSIGSHPTGNKRVGKAARVQPHPAAPQPGRQPTRIHLGGPCLESGVYLYLANPIAPSLGSLFPLAQVRYRLTCTRTRWVLPVSIGDSTHLQVHRTTPGTQHLSPQLTSLSFSITYYYDTNSTLGTRLPLLVLPFTAGSDREMRLVNGTRTAHAGAGAGVRLKAFPFVARPEDPWFMLLLL